jgi:hypothetical protein
MSEVEAPRGGSHWPAAAVAIVAMLVGAGLFVFQNVAEAPGRAIEAGREVLGDLEKVARAFRSGNVRTSFISYATEVSGNSYLQFATLDQVEIFRREDRATVLWGQLELPEVIVEATAPVQYTYYLDLDDSWDFRLEADTVHVSAPEIRHNRPSVDASALRYEVRQGSVMRDEDAALQKLQSGLTQMAEQRAGENVALVRELGRRKTAQFVETWLSGTLGLDGNVRVVVEFADERRPPPPIAPKR